MTYFAIIIGVFLLVVNFVALPVVQFRRDGHNPYRRYCKKCEQRQEFHTLTMEDRYGWWEDMGMIKNESCDCHKYSEYH